MTERATRARRHVYGPVPSRRLGLSLGVDLIPHKVCCYDCLYCQVGPTTCLTTERRRFFDTGLIVRQVAQALERGPVPEIISLAGSGEPTLAADLDELHDGLRQVTSLPLALLTNGGLLADEQVAAAARRFDWVLPSLDAPDPETFRRINRPAPGMDFEAMLAGLRRFCQTCSGRCRLEIMLVQGLNDSPATLAALAELVRGLKVDAVDLNTVVRPPAHGAVGLDVAAMQRALSFFAGLPAGVIAEFRPAQAGSSGAMERTALRRAIEDTLARRPCTLEDLSSALGASPLQIQQLCRHAVAEGAFEERFSAEKTYYALRGAPAGT